jgi:AraC-like DNA-binding protein
VRLTGALFFLAEGSSPYVAEAPGAAELAPAVLPGAQQIVSYHVVREGGCWFSLLPEGEPVWLAAGDVLVVSHGDAYRLANPRDTLPTLSPQENLEAFRRLARRELPAVLVEGGGGDPPVRLICGFLGCDVRPFNPALAALPQALVVRPSGDGSAERLRRLAQLVVLEAEEPGAGSACVLLRLGELLFVEVIRRYLAGLTDGESGWLAGLRDPFVGRALQLIHQRPEQAWTLASLASGASLSRSALAERFAGFVGCPPMQYLARCRMQRAARLLADGGAKVAAVAHAVGYDSEAAFSRAFKKTLGVSPAHWRRIATGTAGAG